MELKGSIPRHLFFAIFAISGFAGLIYESIWSHYLKLFLGHAAYAQTLVLVIFMGGMALGSWVASRMSESARAPLLIYAGAEIVIGFAAIVFHDLFIAATDFYFGQILPSVSSPTLAIGLKLAGASLLILPQSILLGMTFPLMSAGILRRYRDGVGSNLSMLYFTNSIGAAIGVLASGFWLIDIFGLPGTVLTAGVLNVLLGVVVWVLARIDPDRKTEAIRKTAGPESDSRLTLVFTAAAFITGAASFIYEIGWIRMLSHVLGATTHSFELMLSAFITGLALGGLWIKRRIDGIESPVQFSGGVQFLMGILALLTIPVFLASYDWMSWLIQSLNANASGYVAFSVASHAIAMAVMLPTTIAAGMTLPLFTYTLLQTGSGERSIGRIYAANTVGAIAGVLFAVHIGLPMLGMKNLIIVGATLDILLGLFLLMQAATAPRLRWAAAGISVIFLPYFASIQLDPRLVASGVYRQGNVDGLADSEVVFTRDGKTASITLVSLENGQMSLSTNGKPDAAIQVQPNQPIAPDEITLTLLGSLAIAYNPDARRIANIGLGSGKTTHVLLSGDQIESVDTVEIEPSVIEAARLFGDPVSRAFNDERSRIHVEDAKTYFSMQDGKYDVIIAEPSNPWVSGVASLFSMEFYATIRKHLQRDGLFAQWIQLYEFNDTLVLSILKAFTRNFDDYVIYTMDTGNILLIGKNHGQLDEPDWGALFDSGYGEELGLVDIHSKDDLLIRLVGTKPIIDTMTTQSAVPSNSDFFPVVDQSAGMARFIGDRAEMFATLQSAPQPVLAMLNGTEIDFSNISETVWLDHVNEVRVAYEVLNHISGVAEETSKEPEPALTNSSLGLKARWLKAVSSACTRDIGGPEWHAALLSLAEATLPFLSPEHGQAMLNVKDGSNCDSGNHEHLNRWRALYSAVAQRDAVAMSSQAEGILASPADQMSGDQRRYAYAAGLLGYLANDDFEGARSLWSQHQGSLYDSHATPRHVAFMGAMLATAH